MQITPTDVEQKQFNTCFRGFNKDDVSRFLEQIADELASTHEINNKLTAETEYLRLEKQGYKEREETFRRAILNSQKTLDQMKENARKSAEVIVADAEVRAEKILNRAHIRLAQLHEDIMELKRQRLQIEVQIRSIVDAHSKLLEIGKEGMTILDEEDSKVKLLNR